MNIQPEQDSSCACCEEAFAGYADRHPFDSRASEPWHSRGGDAWNCPFCFEVCHELDQQGRPQGHVDDVCRAYGEDLLGHVYIGSFGDVDVPSCAVA